MNKSDFIKKVNNNSIEKNPAITASVDLNEMFNKKYIQRKNLDDAIQTLHTYSNSNSNNNNTNLHIQTNEENTNDLKIGGNTWNRIAQIYKKTGKIPEISPQRNFNYKNNQLLFDNDYH